MEIHLGLSAGMSKVFLLILNNALTAGWVILAVVMLRIVLQKAPKWVNCLFWCLVAVRLVIPFPVESAFSLIPSAQPVPVNIESVERPEIDTGLSIVDNAVNPVVSQLVPVDRYTSNPAAGIYPVKSLLRISSVVWLSGVAGMLLYAFFSYVALKKKLRGAVPVFEIMSASGDRGGPAGKRRSVAVYSSPAIDTPFILGLIRPRIYLPDGFPEKEKEFVLAHEENHIRRGDHIWKPLGFLLLSVYWFQPLAWLAYALFSKDIEHACDEKTTKDKDKTWRADYCQALLNCSSANRRFAACPVAFGEIGVKDRVKSVLDYKKPAFWIICAGVFACIVLAVCFLTNPTKTYGVKIVVPANCVGKFSYSSEEVHAKGSGHITLTAGENLHDTEVMLVPMEGTGEMKIIKPFYMTQGMPVKVTLEKDTWYILCVNVENGSNEPRDVYVNVKGARLREMDYQPSADHRIPYTIPADVVGREEDIIIGRHDPAVEAAMKESLKKQIEEQQALDGFEESLKETSFETHPIGISLPQGYSIGAYREELGLAGGTLIEPVSYHCYENSPGYARADWQYSGFLCKFPAEAVDIQFVDGQPELGADGIPTQDYTVRNGIVTIPPFNPDGWWCFLITETHDLFQGALLDSTSKYRDSLQDIDLSQFDTEATYYYYYFIREGEPFYYYLSLSAKEFDSGQASRIAQTVKLPTEKPDIKN